MTILAVDTTSEFGSVALQYSGSIVGEITIHSPEGFSHLIFDAIDRLLTQARTSLDWVRLEKIDLFAAASGPGSFTGLRVGLAAVKGLAQATGKPAIGVSNLQALASFGNLPLRAAFIDARRGELYTAVYGPDLAAVVPEAVFKQETWLESLHEPLYQFLSPLGPEVLAGTRFDAMPYVQTPRSLAAAVALCAEQAVPGDPVALDANYVRRSDAELFWQDR